MKRLPAIIVEDIDKSTTPGSLEPRYVDGELGGFAYRCPGCGQNSWLPAMTDQKHPYSWLCTQEDPVTLSPSIHHTVKKGGCGWHGYLRDGVFESVQ